MAEPGDMPLMPPFRFHDARFWYHALIATGSLGFFLFFKGKSPGNEVGSDWSNVFTLTDSRSC